MRKKMLPLLAPTLLLLAALLAGCNKDETDANQLPDGKHPLTLTATMEGLTATRATPDNSQWTGNEELAISVDEGTSQKVYWVKNTNGDMEPKSPNDGFYWKDKTPLNITAWYPVDFNITSIKDQNQNGVYEKLDFLYATHTNLAFNATAQLSFTHRMAKVTAKLQAGIGLMESDLNGAVVQFCGYTGATVSLSGGTLTNPDKLDWITAKKGSSTTYAALLIPQSQFSTSTPFIRVLVGERTYFYTPSASDGTQAGQAINYTITVNRTGIDVSMDSWSSMGDDIVGADDSEPMVITVRGEGISQVTATNATSLGSGNQFAYPLDATAVPVLSFTVNDHKWVSAIRIDGVVDAQYEFNNTDRKFSYTLSNIHTNLNITVSTADIVSNLEVGAYVYPDRICTTQKLFLEPAGIIYKTDDTKLYVVAQTSSGYIEGRGDYGSPIINRKPAIADCPWSTTDLETSLRAIFTIQEQNTDAGWPSTWKRLWGYHWYGDEGSAWGHSLSSSTSDGWSDGHFNKDQKGGAYLRAFCVVPINTVKE